MKFWAVVGDANTRKSSTIRALTGVRTSHPTWQLRLSGIGDVSAYVEVSSPQERYPRLSPAAFVKRVRDLTRGTPTDYVLVPLRHDRFNRMHAGINYINHFVRTAGWTCLGIVVTSPGHPIAPFRAYAPRAFTLALQPSNAMARRLRQAWKID